MTTEPMSQPAPTQQTQSNLAPAPATTTPPAAPTPSPAESVSWTPYAPDPKLSANENLVKKAEHDAKVPAGHDPNVPLNPKPAEATPPAAETPKPPEASPPLTLDQLKAPEGFELDPALGTEFLTTLNQHRDNPAALAQALIDLQAKAQTQLSERDSKLWDDTQADWRKQTEADPQIGGAKHASTVATSKQLGERFGGAKFQEALELTGFGNHPEFHRFMTAIAPFVKEAGPVPTPTPAPVKEGRSTTNLYPDMKPK